MLPAGTILQAECVFLCNVQHHTTAPSRSALFLQFLKIGATAFGGNVALVGAIREQIVKKKQWLPDTDVIDGTTLASVLPGPLATNVTAFIGYRLRGFTGALICLGAVLLPSFILVCVLSWLYFRYGKIPAAERIFSGLQPAVAAIILAAAIDMARKNVKTVLQWVLVALGCAAMLLLGGFWTTLGVIIGSGLLGYFLFRKSAAVTPPQKPAIKRSLRREFTPWLFVAAGIAAAFGFWYFTGTATTREELRTAGSLGSTFGGMSVTLFGGGYVFIAAIKDVVVATHGWVTTTEFTDGIAMGQITPGPIMITATFIGWKVGGLLGALVSTVAIFVPPATVTVIASQYLDRIRGNVTVEAIFSGLRPGVIGLIFAAVVFFAKYIPLCWQSFTIFAFVLITALFVKKIDQALLIPVAGLLGYLLY